MRGRAALIGGFFKLAVALFGLAVACFGLGFATGGAALAADYDGSTGYRPFTAAPPEGLPCQDPAVRAFPSVWLGHFSGGYSHYAGPGSAIVLDWRDEKLCFPGRRACDHYIQEMRRDYHRPEGEYTCLPIR